MKKRIDIYNSNIYNSQPRGLTSLRILASLTLFALLFFPLISAQTNLTEEQTKVNKAYSCLQDKISGECATLSTEEKIFSVLSTNQCRSELLSDSANSGECWPAANCRVKDTAQAVLALKSLSSSTQNWLYSKNATPAELVWYLEIEADGATSCTINYGSSAYSISIDAEKKINSGAGACLLLAQDNYWLRVSPSCYNTEFTVSCNQNFLTTTLFRKSTSSTIYVSEETSSAAAGGATRETVDSYCLADSGICSYEGTLWAALALKKQGKDISSYLPYLMTLADENQRYLPDSFLYALTAKQDYKTSLLGKQKSNQWWMESGDKYYDTAAALYPLQKDTSQQKENAKEWLLGSQDPNGCWENNIRNTGFILASVWPRTFAGTGGNQSLPDCESAGKYCASSSTICTSSAGQILNEYDCPGTIQACCSLQPTIKTCSELGGEICSSNERCVGGTTVPASNTRSTEICCAGGGDCRLPVTDEDDTDFEPIPPTSGGSTLWIWILLILIVLVVLGILFRNKLRMLWFRIKPKGGSRPGGPTHHGPPPGFFPPAIQRPIQRIERRILVPQHPVQRPAPSTRMKSGAQKELDDVLRKLKEMGK